MKVIAVLLVLVLAGCANTPYVANYTKADIDQKKYPVDRDYCKKNPLMMR